MRADLGGTHEFGGRWNRRCFALHFGGLAQFFVDLRFLGALVTGKVLSGLGQSVLSIALVLLVLIFGFGFQPRGNPLLMAGIVLLTMLLGAGIGVLAGVLSKKTLAVTSGLITVAILLFLVSGNEDSMVNNFTPNLKRAELVSQVGNQP